MKNIIIITCLTLFSAAVFAQHENHATNADTKIASPVAATFKDEALSKAYNQYILVKDLLVASDAEAAKKPAAELMNALKELKNAEAAVQAATKLANASNLTEQRLAFSPLSDEMAKLVKGGKLSSGSLYLGVLSHGERQYGCVLAFQ